MIGKCETLQEGETSFFSSRARNILTSSLARLRLQKRFKCELETF